ncbi:conserved hypothetical protein [Burkholderia vietnamiensis]|nr:conserved hypothetical protein [Burkholderia vietnamiensis]
MDPPNADTPEKHRLSRHLLVTEFENYRCEASDKTYKSLILLSNIQIQNYRFQYCRETNETAA